MSDELTHLFSQIGFEDGKIKEILKNKKVSNSLKEIIAETNETSPLDKNRTALLHNLLTLCKGDEDNENLTASRKLVSLAIVDGRLKTNLQVSEAYKYVKEQGAKATDAGLDLSAGVGVEVSLEQVDLEVAKYFELNKESISEQRYKAVPAILGEVKKIEALKWAEPRLFKPIIDKHVLLLLGPKDERDLAGGNKKKKEAKSGGKKASAATSGETKQRSMFSEGFLGELHKPGENPQLYPELMKDHLLFTKGKVFTRFPPEPNGYLHIGHSKLILVNFGYAKYHGGHCYLRYDDTNPEAEEDRYVISIKNMIEWLGFEPWKITYSSDYFDQLYELAEKLIQVDKLYVCHCTAEEVKHQRGLKEDGTLGGERFACEHRSRSVEENLKEFRRMKNGEYDVGKATLRMKQDLTSPSPQMWDLVAYRVLNARHHRTGDRWKIYPTYDFTHCLVDSFENISHSLCTTEFYLSRESYEWLCDLLHVYRPLQREYGRLNITGTIMSKRKIAKLVNEGYVRGWDDPRLYTLELLRRRGIPPGLILSFINTLGVTTSTTNIQAVRLDSSVRLYLDVTTPRLMMIMDPVPVVIDNLPEDYQELVTIPFKPGTPEFGERQVPFGRKIYIDRSDYRDEVDKEYFRLAPGQSVGLMKVGCNLSVKSVERDSNGKITLIHGHYDNDIKFVKPKTYIQWIPESADYKPVVVKEVRIHNQLFKSENPSLHPEGFLKDINPDSEEIVKGALVEKLFWDIKLKSPFNHPTVNEEFNIKEKKDAVESCRFQALRTGYFSLDKDTEGEELIFNRIVTLKEDSSKS